MLIATLPTMVSSQTKRLAEKIISHPLIDAVRYNTGGASPYPPKQILEIIKPIADAHKKILYVDLEGRQIRVAKWTPFSKGVATLNRDFAIELPARINFRRAGWFDVVNALPGERKIFFKPYPTKREYYLGESQSVNIVAKNFQVKGCLQDFDLDYIKIARELDITHFMLSFVESFSDVCEVYKSYFSYNPIFSIPQLVLKIESLKGIEFVKNEPGFPNNLNLMAARDDLFLSFVDKRSEFLDALKIIIKKDPNAILASKLMTGLLDFEQELTVGDMTDIMLMRRFGYRHFMLQDELADCFDSAMQNWGEIWKKK